jgi:hypothetical protein
MMNNPSRFYSLPEEILSAIVEELIAKHRGYWYSK